MIPAPEQSQNQEKQPGGEDSSSGNENDDPVTEPFSIHKRGKNLKED